jgi:hypothetical protein
MFKSRFHPIKSLPDHNVNESPEIIMCIARPSSIYFYLEFLHLSNHPNGNKVYSHRIRAEISRFIQKRQDEKWLSLLSLHAFALFPPICFSLIGVEVHTQKKVAAPEPNSISVSICTSR